MRTNTRAIEITVGVFILVGFLALLMLALQVSGLGNIVGNNGYNVTATFTNIGDLRVRAPVSVAGVRIGEVSNITLDPATYRAVVTMQLEKKSQIPVDSSASIFTEGLLGSNYISINPGFSNTFLKNGGNIQNTHSALILENLIGQLMYKLNSNSSGSKK